MYPDPTDRLILQRLQDQFPLEEDPWECLGQQISLSGDEVLERVRRLQASGILRGICPVIESGKAGIGASTLVALRVPAGRINEVAGIISRVPEVSHNYQRDNPYNLWFTLGCRDRQELERVLKKIQALCSLDGTDMIELPARRRFKIDVRFPIFREGD